MSEEPVIVAPPASSSRLEGCNRWDSSGWHGLRVIVVGIGKSGFSAAKALAGRGSEVMVIDECDEPPMPQVQEDLRHAGVRDIVLGESRLRGLPTFGRAEAAADLIVTSPALPARHRFFSQAVSLGIPVWSDIELAWRLRLQPGRRAAPWLCVTGTNGKTTTTALVESMLRQAAEGERPLRIAAVGNIGKPILEVLCSGVDYDYLVVELSSFQLHWTYSVSPYASVCLNIAEDHLQWHGSYGNYFADKAKIYRNTQRVCAYNADVEETKTMAESAEVMKGCRIVGFTLGPPSRGMMGVAEGVLTDCAFTSDKEPAGQIVTFSELKRSLGQILPAHIVANILAASVLARAVGIPIAAVRAGIAEYRLGAHRMEYVKTRSGVDYIDDSKATNPHAALASLRCFKSVVWIIGGLSKGVDYAGLIEQAAPLLRGVIIIGEEQDPVLRALAAEAADIPREIVTPYEDSDQESFESSGDGRKLAARQSRKKSGDEVMTQAVAAARRMARSGDVVLLAPAAASMDQFLSYDDRGKKFVSAVMGDVRES